MSSGPSSPYSPLVFDIHIKLQSSFLYVVLYRISAHDDDIQNSFFKLFIDLFLAVLGRLCSASFSPVVAAVGERLITMGSLVADHRLWARGLQERQRTSSAVVAPGLESAGSGAVARGLAAPRPVRSSPTRHQSHVSCVGRRILYP